MMAIILWAHRQRLSESQTHKAPAAAVGCCRGTAASNPQSNAPRPSPSAPLRPTWPTLTNIPQRAGQPTFRGILPPPAVSPFGQGASRPAGQLHSQYGAPPSHPGAGSRPTPLPNLTHSKMRPTHNQPDGKHFHPSAVGLLWLRSVRRGTAAAVGLWSFRGQTTPDPQCKYPSCCLLAALPVCRPCLGRAQPPVPKALRPPLHLSKRNVGSVCSIPAMRVRRSPAVRQYAASCPRCLLCADGAASFGR